jgi:phospholipase C
VGRRVGAAVVLALLLLGGFLGVWVEKGAFDLPRCPVPGSTAYHSATTPVKHVFLIIKENHAFENYFGTYPGVVGAPPSGDFLVQYGTNRTIAPFPLPGTSTPDLPHDRIDLVAAVDGGRMDHFVAQGTSSGSAEPLNSVGYYTSHQLSFYFGLAANYTLRDMFFSGVLGPTLPNRLFDLAATSGNWTSDDVPPPSAMVFPTILDQLSQAGVPWAYDFGGSERNLTPLFLPSISDDPCKVANIQPMLNLPDQLSSPDPPAVTVLDPSHDPVYSEHPAQNVTLGSEWTASILHRIFSSPIGSSSAAFVLFDEGGGFWDPVAPPIFDALGDGVRVPLIAVSPWTPQGKISNLSSDPASLLRFVDENWGLAPLNSRVATAAGVDDLFDFSAAPRPYDGPTFDTPLESPAPAGSGWDALRATTAAEPLSAGGTTTILAASPTTLAASWDPEEGISHRSASRDRWAGASFPSITRSRCSSSLRARSSRSR